MTHDSPLGKSTQYHQNYSPELLFAIPRSQQRQSLNWKGPMYGFDQWTAFELSWLNTKGLPQVAIAEFHFSADSTYIIESKSFKLYLNSFNQHRLESKSELISLLSQDLSRAAGAPVKVEIFSTREYETARPTHFPEAFYGITPTNLDTQDLEITNYGYEENSINILLKQLLIRTKSQTSSEENESVESTDSADSTGPMVEEVFFSDLLKSNCLVTKQPDWGSVWIYYQGPHKINPETLMRYLISFRNHNEFHEHCIERIYTDIISNYPGLLSLAVYGRYVRRGGLDINPFRSTAGVAKPQRFRTPRQ